MRRKKLAGSGKKVFIQSFIYLKSRYRRAISTLTEGGGNNLSLCILLFKKQQKK